MNLRVLLAESDAEDVLFLREALTEIEAGRHWSNWIRIETLHADTWAKAATILAHEAIDLFLLDLNLADSQGSETFRRAQAAASQVPVILLTCAEDAEMAARLVRDGAQDFLIKKQIDCAPLAHAMRNAIERHRLLSATRAASTIDSLTGLPNRGSFLTFADRDRKLAERLGRRLMVLVGEPRNLPAITAAYGDQRRDLRSLKPPITSAAWWDRPTCSPASPKRTSPSPSSIPKSSRSRPPGPASTPSPARTGSPSAQRFSTPPTRRRSMFC